MKTRDYEFLVMIDGELHLASGKLHEEIGLALGQLHVELQNVNGEIWVEDGRGGKSKKPVIKDKYPRDTYTVIGGRALGTVYEELYRLRTPDCKGQKPRGLVMVAKFTEDPLRKFPWAREALASR